MLPVGSFAGGAEAIPPEAVQAELAPKLGEHPPTAPLAGTAQLEVLQPHLHAIGRGFGEGAFRGEEFELFGSAFVFIEDFDRANPLLLLAVVDLAELQGQRCATRPPLQRRLSTSDQ